VRKMEGKVKTGKERGAALYLYCTSEYRIIIS